MNRLWVTATAIAIGFIQPIRVVAGQAAAAAQPARERVRPSVVAIRAVDTILLDGRLDEETWRRATPASGFTQREPDDGHPSLEQTEVRVAYDTRALYIGITCLSSAPVSIRA